MKTCLRICYDDYDAIQRHLSPTDGKEAIIFALCGRTQSANRLVFTVHEILLIPYHRCVRKNNFLYWRTKDVLLLMDKAMDKHMAIMRMHSHPGGWAHFSKADLATDKEFFGNLMTAWCEDGLPHLSTIMLPDGKIIGKVYYADGTVQKLDFSLVIGQRINMIQYDKKPINVPPDEALRNIQAFGDGTYNTFKQMRIGVVGCSGTGCHVIEQLMRLQVGELVLVDPDTIEAKNLNRLTGTGKKDIGKYKVEFYKNYIKRANLGVKVLAFPVNLYQSDEARRALSTCDVIFGCVDSSSGRMLLNHMSTFYLTSYIDVGVGLEADGNGGVSYVGIQMDYMIPGMSTLMSRGSVKSDDVRAELNKLYDPEAYEQLRKEKYINNVQVNRPAVISVNGLIAYLAVLNLIDRIVGFRQEQQYAKITFLLSSDDIIKRREDDFGEEKNLKRFKGRGDYEPYVNMIGLM